MDSLVPFYCERCGLYYEGDLGLVDLYPICPNTDCRRLAIRLVNVNVCERAAYLLGGMPALWSLEKDQLTICKKCHKTRRHKRGLDFVCRYCLSTEGITSDY